LELDSVSHREYCTGYYLDEPKNEPNLCTTGGYIREKAYFAEAPAPESDEERDALPNLPEGIETQNENGRLYLFVQRNKVKLGDLAEIISPGKVGRAFTVSELYLPDGTPIESAPHPSMHFFVRVPFSVAGGDIMREGRGE
jgi:putative protease